MNGDFMVKKLVYSIVFLLSFSKAVQAQDIVKWKLSDLQAAIRDAGQTYHHQLLGNHLQTLH
jgi:hypothetical protein